MPLRLIRPCLALAGALLAFLLSAQAQESWSVSNSGTTQNLWGATWGGGQFVVVGEGGAILTSPDAITWTARTSGTTDWMVGVGYSSELKQYVAVGDHGDILTSADGVSWTAQTSGTAQRLNGIAYGGGVWMAVGQAGTVLTSADGKAWAALAPPAALTNGWLRGIAYLNGKFILAAVYPAPTDNNLFPTGTGLTVTPTGIFEGVPDNFAGGAEAVATNGHQVIAVGSLALTSPASYPLSFSTRYAPNSFALAFTYLRGATWFNGDWIAAGDRGIILYGAEDVGGYTPVNAAASTIDFYSAAAGADAAVVVGKAGTVMRSPLVLRAPTAKWLTYATSFAETPGSTLTLQAAATGSQPISYQWNFNGQPISGATSTTLTLSNIQPKDAGAYSLTASSALGTDTTKPRVVTVYSPLTITAPVDTTFVTPLTGEPGAVAIQADGKLLVAGTVTSASGNVTGVVRLNADGQLDSTFHAVPLTSPTRIQLMRDGRILVSGPWTSYPPNTPVRFTRLNPDGSADSSFTSASVIASGYVLLADNRIVVIAIANNVATLTRLNADGTPDNSYPRTSLALGPFLTSATVDEPWYTGAVSTFAPDGHSLLGFVSYRSSTTLSTGLNQTQLVRLQADGTVDPSFATATVAAAVDQLASTTSGIYYRTGFTDYAGTTQMAVGRLTPTGGADSGYHGQSFVVGLGQPRSALELLDDGSYLFTSSTGIVDYDASGDLNPEFRAVFSQSSSGNSIDRLVVADLGHIYTLGSFTALDGVPVAYLARILPETQASATRLTNVSVRQSAGADAATLTLGFVIVGNGSRPMLVRGIGPTLATYHVQSPLPDPTLALITSNAAVASNDDWGDQANAATIVDTTAAVGGFPLPAGSKDAAMLVTLPSANYTAQIGTKGATGIALAEAYDTGSPPASYAGARVTNFSARGTAGSGDSTLIAGFALDGPGTKQLLIRAVGPGLNRFGVSGTLPDPLLTVFSGNTEIAASNSGNSSVDVAAAAKSAGAFDLVFGDAAMVITLPAGSYTAEVGSIGGNTGVALVEVYELR